MKGTVKFFSEKGFGFVTAEDGTDYFVHFTSIQKEGFKSLRDGEDVEFDVTTDPASGKARAVNVTGPGGKEPMGAQRKGKDGKGFDKGGKGFSGYGKGYGGKDYGYGSGGYGGGYGGKDYGYGGKSYGGKDYGYGGGAYGGKSGYGDSYGYGGGKSSYGMDGYGGGKASYGGYDSGYSYGKKGY